MNIPIIRMEIEHMKHSLYVALSDYAVQMDEDIKIAIEKFCTPENISKIINQAVEQTLNAIIKEEIKNFYVYGNGREAIRRAIEERLSQNKTFTPLDE